MSLENVHAVLIGAEQFGLGKDWELDGPCDDVASMAAWLIGVGVWTEHIRVLSAPLVKNAELFRQRLAEIGLTAKATEQPSSAAIEEVFKRRLPSELSRTSGEGLLFVYWAGHGLYDPEQHPPQRMVFCSNLDARVAPAIPIDSLARWLRAQLPTFRVVLIVDACATQKDRLNVQGRLDPVDFPTKGLKRPLPFLAVFSCSEGESAINIGKGLFTSELLTDLATLKPGSPSEFQALDGAIRAARDRVMQRSGNKQLVVRDFFEDWLGMRDMRSSEPRKPGRWSSAIDLDAANLCDRKEQWGSFRSLARNRVQTLSNQVVFAVAHGTPNQSADAFFKKLVHKIQRSANEFHRCQSATEEPLALELHGKLNASQVAAELRREVLDRLQLEEPPESAQEQSAAISTRINQDGRAVVFTAAIQSNLLRSNKTLLEDIRTFWEGLPTIKGRSLAVCAIFIWYEVKKPGLRGWLAALGSSNRWVRTHLEQSQYVVQPELGDVTRSDLYEWGTDMKALWPDWQVPSEHELNEICPADQVRPMAEVVEGLKELLRRRELRQRLN